MHTPHRPHRLVAVALLTLIATGAALTAASTAHAAQNSATGAEGQRLTVSKADGLAPAGEQVAVTGSGYDENKGIYVAYCVDNGVGVAPGPCGGGADTSGSLGASHWISSNPPQYGEGLAVPYDSGGSFSVTLSVTPAIEEFDCTTGGCAVVTRADHTRGSDRTQDVRVPISFGTSVPDPAAGAADPDPHTEGTAPKEPATGADGVSVITAGPVPTGTPGPVADALELTRSTVDGTAGRWWWLTTGGLLALLALVLATGRIMRWRRTRKAGS